VDKNAEVWEKDPSYVKKLNPKYVRRRDGVKERYDPTRHC
jgi:23S rRNA maturation-related 3'-5' exoribonuclease YhaM